MAYILSKDRPHNSHEEWRAGWAAYRSYLDSVRGRMPRAAFEFAAADWHYDFSDHRAPHDGWLEALEIREHAAGARRQYGRVEILVRLLAAHHDGHIELRYTDVQSYSLASSVEPDAGRRDWLYDEVRLSEGGRVEHEVEWSGGGLWLIECGDLAYAWLPPRPAGDSATV